MQPPPKPINTLSDEFGQFTVVINERQSDPQVLARLVGWSAELKSIAKRMRCSACQHKQVSVEGRRLPRRSWAIDIKRD